MAHAQKGSTTWTVVIVLRTHSTINIRLPNQITMYLRVDPFTASSLWRGKYINRFPLPNTKRLTRVRLASTNIDKMASDSDSGDEEVTFSPNLCLGVEHVPGGKKGGRGYFKTDDGHLFRANKKMSKDEEPEKLYFMYCYHFRTTRLASIDVKCKGTGVMNETTLQFFPRRRHNHDPGMKLFFYFLLILP